MLLARYAAISISYTTILVTQPDFSPGQKVKSDYIGNRDWAQVAKLRENWIVERRQWCGNRTPRPAEDRRAILSERGFLIVQSNPRTVEQW
jgi:hypothetical protein